MLLVRVSILIMPAALHVSKDFHDCSALSSILAPGRLMVRLSMPSMPAALHISGGLHVRSALSSILPPERLMARLLGLAALHSCWPPAAVYT